MDIPFCLWLPQWSFEPLCGFSRLLLEFSKKANDNIQNLYVGSLGYYWSSTADESNSNSAYYLSFGSSGENTDDNYRDYWHTVRPVAK